MINLTYLVDFISKIATVIGVPVAIWAAYVALKSIHKQSELAAASYSTQLVNIAASINQAIANNKELASIWKKGGENPSSLDAIEKTRYELQVRNSMLVYENVIFQHRHEMLDSEIYRTWENDIRQFSSENRHAVLGDITQQYSSDLCDLISGFRPTLSAAK